MLRFDKATYLSLLLKFLLSARLNNILRRSDAPLYLDLINIVSIVFYEFIEFIMLLNSFLGIFLLDPKNIWFDTHLVSAQMYLLCKSNW